MPAPETFCRTPVLGHVNLMLDTFIASASVEDLRAITRNLLATSPSSVTQSYKTCARNRLRRSVDSSAEDIPSIFFHKDIDSFSTPTPQLNNTLLRARKLYGAGFGSYSLPLLTAIVRATVGARWRSRGDMADLLAIIDGDIVQAIQSTKEEIISDESIVDAAVRDAVENLKKAVLDSKKDVQTWNGRFTFGRAEISICCWKL